MKIPAQSPNCNPYAGRFVRTIKHECLNHFILFGERHRRHGGTEFVAHYNRERFHQGLGRLIKPKAAACNDNSAGNEVLRRSRLGGLLNFYQRKAA